MTYRETWASQEGLVYRIKNFIGRHSTAIKSAVEAIAITADSATFKKNRLFIIVGGE